ncbi:hypothetical protein AB0G02_36815 [Actinosynnema sp. NPDC023658]|uniref:hypothetical protein n=1 Tax=Actinosynnema sp. NPDC023658 TaxID=3155465 RepID=UPI003403C34F
MKAQTLLAARPDAPLREVARESGISVSTALDVRRRLQRGEDPVRRRPGPGRSPSVPVPVVAGTAGPDDPGVDLHAVLQSLRRDPSLRFSETGRTLLQWLSVRELAVDDPGRVVESIPEHVRENVAKLAWSCAEVWRQLAQELQRDARRRSVHDESA